MPDLTVMTWNIQNLFPVGHVDGPATQQEYDDKVAGLAEVINAVEPDVLALQEVGPEQGLAGIDFDNRLVGSPDGRGIRVALLSPRLLSNSVDITTFPLGVVPVQSRDLIFDNPATPENEALSAVLGRGVLSATVRAGGEQSRCWSPTSSPSSSHTPGNQVWSVAACLPQTMRASVCATPAMRSTAAPPRP